MGWRDSGGGGERRLRWLESLGDVLPARDDRPWDEGELLRLGGYACILTASGPISFGVIDPEPEALGSIDVVVLTSSNFEMSSDRERDRERERGLCSTSCL